MSTQTKQDERRSGNLLVNFFRSAPGTPVEAPPARPARREVVQPAAPEPARGTERRLSRRELIAMENERRAREDAARRQRARQQRRQRTVGPDTYYGDTTTWSDLEAAAGTCTPARNAVTGPRQETSGSDEWEAYYQGKRPGLLGRLFGK